LQAYTRWQADDFGVSPALPEAVGAETVVSGLEQGAPDTSEGVLVDQVKLPTAEDLERMHEDARQGGYQAGHDEGYRVGHEAGYTEGRKIGLANAEAYVTELRSLCQGLAEALQAFDQDMAESVLACALEVAGQLTRAVIHVKPEEVLLPVIRAALAALPLHHGPVTLLVAPSEATVAREHLEQQFSQDGWRIQEDTDIAPGGCRLRTDSSEVDATLETRWRRVLEAIGVTPEWLLKEPGSGNRDRS
jgi:flagellar assembly protein FliH